MTDVREEDLVVEQVFTDVSDSVAFAQIDELVKNRRITEAEGDLLKGKYQELFEANLKKRGRDLMLNKKIRLLQSELASEKVVLEKARLDESDEMHRFQALEVERDELQKDVRVIEQHDLVTKFELAELRKVHTDLTEALEKMRRDNRSQVEPVLQALRDEIATKNQELEQIDVTFARESTTNKNLLVRLKEVESIKENKVRELAELQTRLDRARMEPGRLSRQADATGKAVASMLDQLKELKNKIEAREADIAKIQQRKESQERLRQTIVDKNAVHRLTIEKREKDVGAVLRTLEDEKAKLHDNVTKKVELSIAKKEVDAEYRHKSEALNFMKKDYESAKRMYKKKRSYVDGIRQAIPVIESQLIDEEHNIKLYRTEITDMNRRNSILKDELDVNLAEFLSQEGIEKSKKEELMRSVEEVEAAELDVANWRAESKRQQKLINVLSTQRDIVSRECSRVTRKATDAKEQVHFKELSVLDATKRSNEVANRLKEFSALYEVVKNERNKYVNLIQSSSQALAEMKEKIRILNNEFEILRNEGASKDKALAKEKVSHAQAIGQRDGLRQEMNKLLSEYRQKQSVVEQQIQEIDKLNLVINNLEQRMLELKNRYEKYVEQRNSTGVQLIDHNDELCILYERSNQQQDYHKNGELEMRKKEEEARMLQLQIGELRRQYGAAQKRVPEIEKNIKLISELEEKLRAEQAHTEELSAMLEDPSNASRWRPLDGEDPDMDQLQSKLKMIEDRLDEKREQLLEKELILEEVTVLTERLRDQALQRRDASKALSNTLGDMQTKIRDVTKKMLATVSELSMYQATALRLQQEKVSREEMLEEAKWKISHGEAPTEDAAKEWARMERKRAMREEAATARAESLRLQEAGGEGARTTAEARPTAYIPDELGLPKPYGGSAPFKPTELGSTMRHIRIPNPKPIEI